MIWGSRLRGIGVNILGLRVKRLLTYLVRSCDPEPRGQDRKLIAYTKK